MGDLIERLGGRERMELGYEQEQGQEQGQEQEQEQD